MTYATIQVDEGTSGKYLATDRISAEDFARYKLVHGAEGSATDVSQAAPLPVYDFELAVARGLVTGTTGVNKFGRNTAVGTSAETVWLAGATRTDLTAAQTLDIVSSSTDDDGSPAGSGAHAITIEGIDDSYNAASETYTLDGTTPVTTTGDLWWFINRMYVSGNDNVGTITVTGNTDTGTTVGSIGAGDGQTLTSCYVVPNGKKLYVKQYTASINRSQTSGAIDLEMRVKDFENGGPMLLKHQHGYQVAGKPFPVSFMPYFQVSGKHLIEFNATATGTGFDVSVTWDGYLVDD